MTMNATRDSGVPGASLRAGAPPSRATFVRSLREHRRAKAVVDTAHHAGFRVAGLRLENVETRITLNLIHLDPVKPKGGIAATSDRYRAELLGLA